MIKQFLVELEYDGRFHWFSVLVFDKKSEFLNMLKLEKIDVEDDTVAYCDNYADGDECGRMYLYYKDVETIAHEATHMALGIIARHGHKNIITTTEEEPELSHDLCKLVGFISDKVYGEIEYESNSDNNQGRNDKGSS